MITLAEALEIVEQLPGEQQDMLMQIVRSRQIERRRDEIAQNAHESMAAYRAGQLQSHSAESAIAELRAALDAPEEL